MSDIVGIIGHRGNLGAQMAVQVMAHYETVLGYDIRTMQECLPQHGIDPTLVASDVPPIIQDTRRIEPLLPVVALIETSQAGIQDDLGGKARLHITGEDGAVADLRRDHFIDGQQRTLAQMAVGIIGIGIGGCCAACFAVELGGVGITAAINHLCC